MRCCPAFGADLALLEIHEHMGEGYATLNCSNFGASKWWIRNVIT